jgi:gliding motility-associated-like protein
MSYFKYIFIFLIGLSSFYGFATHNRAGEITYRLLSSGANGYRYEITITTYTKVSPPSNNADRPELFLYYDYYANVGDTIPRVSEQLIPDADAKINKYVGIHTYPGPGIYYIAMEDPNRNGGVVNISNSINTSFFIFSKVYINPFVGANNSVQLLEPPIDEACLGKKFCHNAAAFDIDGDSISYEMDTCRLSPTQTVAGFFIPSGISLNSNGDFCWDVPTQLGEFNFAFRIIEWRKNEYGIYVKIGEVVRDMQINVRTCNNNPPTIFAQDECVEATKYMASRVLASDPDGLIVTLSATGGALSVNNSPALFPNPISGFGTVQDSIRWNTVCQHIRNQPYLSVYKAKDTGFNINLTAIRSVNYRVIAPAPKNLNALALGNSITVTWDNSICNQVRGYEIYRKLGSTSFTPSPCQSGLPSSLGYTKIATINNNSTIQFNDNNNGNGLILGETYCYRIVAFYPDGARSYASEEVCAELKKDVPVITNVSILNTDIQGSVFLQWSKPTELDTIQIPGPYQYIVYQRLNNQFTKIDSTPVSVNLNDTNIIITNRNTFQQQFYYVELWQKSATNTFRIGRTNSASSVFLTIKPTDNRNILNWGFNVPWRNDTFEVYRKSPGSLNFELLTRLTEKTYTDTGLVNGLNYCYYVKTIGEYSSEDISKPLLNNSQETCAVPIDNEAPCAIDFVFETACDVESNRLSWKNPNNFCSDDAVKYRVYYKQFENEEFKLLKEIVNMNDTIFLHNNNGSLAGCYYVTAVDSFNNESVKNKEVCADNCPIYELPNVFTPDADGVNDYFKPFPYRFVESIDLKIYNRWGSLIYETTQADINWNGTLESSGTVVPQGVYYYTCTVNEIKLSGIVARELKGYLHILRASDNIPTKK